MAQELWDHQDELLAGLISPVTKQPDRGNGPLDHPEGPWKLVNEKGGMYLERTSRLVKSAMLPPEVSGALSQLLADVKLNRCELGTIKAELQKRKQDLTCMLSKVAAEAEQEVKDQKHQTEDPTIQKILDGLEEIEDLLGFEESDEAEAQEEKENKDPLALILHEVEEICDGLGPDEEEPEDSGLREMVEGKVGGKEEEDDSGVTVLPDGSAFMTGTVGEKNAADGGHRPHPVSTMPVTQSSESNEDAGNEQEFQTIMARVKSGLNPATLAPEALEKLRSQVRKAYQLKDKMHLLEPGMRTKVMQLLDLSAHPLLSPVKVTVQGKKEAYIEKEKSQFVVKDESGKTKGKHKTKADAVDQLRAIEVNKHKSAKKTKKWWKKAPQEERVQALQSVGIQKSPESKWKDFEDGERKALKTLHKNQKQKPETPAPKTAELNPVVSRFLLELEDNLRAHAAERKALVKDLNRALSDTDSISSKLEC